MLDVGDRIPDLPLALSTGKAGSLRGFAGKWLVLFFYPKDSTPACTTEGQDFNALLTRFRRAGGKRTARTVAAGRGRIRRGANPRP